MNKWMLLSWWLSCCAIVGCDADLGPAPTLGVLAVSLSSVAGGVEYQLADGHFSLEGPTELELDAGSEPTLSVELAPGAYRLTLAPGYRLVRADDPERKTVPARLVSANPATVLISPGEIAQLTLRFELSAGTSGEAGTLQIDLAVDASGADAGTGGGCNGTLLLTEVDYEQAGTDEGEFVELLNSGTCPAPLAGVVLELVNGGDGKVYSRYDLGTLAPALAAGARLVLGDAAVLATLPAGTLSAPLNGSGLQNGPDGVRLMRADNMLDALTYEGEIAGFPGTPGPADEAEQGLSRCPETSVGALRLAAPTPAVANACM
ncbi:MAG TPA: lamin tail domain-containing protein [Polyangiales bacterium]